MVVRDKRSARPLHRRPGLVLGLLLSAAAMVALGQPERYDGQVIQEIEYVGLRALSSETLDHYLLGRKEGDEPRRLDLTDLNERILKLWSRELIEDIKVAAEPAEGGIKLIISIEERPLLTSIDYVGIKRVGRSDIAEAIDRERVGVYEGRPLDRGELRRLKTVIEGLYREKGYRFAEVSYTPEEISPGQMRITFTIDEGDKVKIGDIDFDGNTVFSDWRLRTSMKETKESGLISRIRKKDIYNPASIEEDLNLVRDLYRKAGYKDVLVGRPELDVKAKRPNAATIKQQKRRLAVTVPVEEGERWRFGEVSIEGNDVFTDEVLLRQFEKPRGGWLRAKVIDEAIERIGNLYRGVGYIFSEVETELRERDDERNVADVIVHVSEADQFRVGTLEFEGNRKTRDKVLRREFLVQESTVMNMNALRNSLLKIRQLNYFQLNEDEPIKFDFDGEEKTVDLLVQGEEADRTELQFGGGWSEFDGFFGQFALRTRNFLGRGETIGVSVQAGSQRELYDLEYRIPWFRDRRQSVGARVFKQDFDNDRVFSDFDFSSQRTGASISYGRGLAAFQSMGLTYSFTDFEDVQTFVDDEGMRLRSEETFRHAAISPSWSYNTIDSRFEPFRGLGLNASIEIADTALGGDTRFLRPQVSATWFRPLSRRPLRTTFGLNFEGGFITSYDDVLIFPLQRFIAGGENSVRGFRRRSLFVRNPDGTFLTDENGFRIGGDKFVQLNLEYHVLVTGPFRLVFFADAGGVFGDGQSVDFDLLSKSAGAELRILVPIFGAPLRFIYASNLDPQPGDRFESFDFTIGTSF